MQEGICNKCCSVKFVVIGILVLAWNWYITGTGQLFGKDWPTFIGALLVLKGILHMAKPTCGHVDEMPTVKKKK